MPPWPGLIKDPATVCLTPDLRPAHSFKEDRFACSGLIGDCASCRRNHSSSYHRRSRIACAGQSFYSDPKLLAQQGQRGVTPPGDETHVDHVDPKSKGGS